MVPVSIHVSPRRAFIALIRYDLPDPAVPVMMTCSGSGGGGGGGGRVSFRDETKRVAQ